MHAVIFQVEPNEGRAGDYLDIAALLRPELEKIEGFISIERFESIAQPGKYLSLSFWRDEAAILAWRAHVGHQHAQGLGRGEIFANYRLSVAEIFANYRLSVADIVRDYGMFDRTETPERIEPTWGEDF